ncbi:3-carboxyethylcatechol 2,3-dioxygenase [Sphingobium subterraneum]|uniref:2,3-dihydroxyphenylpropionate 1,2-dioxygenase n=1 Tax=Sphingobium subterraneum TaxID=627688 RepID=A0A841J3I6_9SPHN|nr:2,3-dihydroxyphenylpropionate 1,2-dioxygenase [Sphingobium subterraneum]
MIVGAVCLSHSPLKDSNAPPPDTGRRFNQALEQMADFVSGAEPDLTIVFYPDHLNGFFYQMLPPFCVGIEGTSVGDYGTASGKLDIPEDRATDLARSVLLSGVDTALSHDMQVDHGAIQPLEWLSTTFPLFRMIPIFVNCAAPPLPTFQRVRALGQAVGDWARQAPERILIIGSGGLSHDPPMPSLAGAAPQVRERLVKGTPLPHGQRFARQSKAQLEGQAMEAGKSRLRAINPEWDQTLLDAFVAGDLTVLDGTSDDSIREAGGRGGGEARAWIAALSTLGENYSATQIYYEPVQSWITGMGMLLATANEDQSLTDI